MFVYVNGSVVESAEAKLSVFDHGIVTGDGAFETIAVYGGRPFALTRHLNRLRTSALGLMIQEPHLDEVREAIDLVISQSGLSEGKIRVTYTAGESGLSSDRLAGPPSLVVACEPSDFGNGTVTDVVVVPWLKNERGALRGLKTTSYAENVLSLAYAKQRGGSEALFQNLNGDLCEGTGSNVFVVWDGELVTPPLSSGPLAGITRDLVLEKIGGAERTIPMEAFYSDAISEVFLTSTIREIQGVSSIDGVMVSQGQVGPITLEIAEAFAKLKFESNDL